MVIRWFAWDRRRQERLHAATFRRGFPTQISWGLLDCIGLERLEHGCHSDCCDEQQHSRSSPLTRSRVSQH
jgi:hypothetical protein